MADLTKGDRVTTANPPHVARGTVMAVERDGVRVDWETGARKSINPRRPGERILYTHDPAGLRKIEDDER